MDLVRHCELCDHQKVTLKEGTTCGLTEKKPAFNKTCSKIALNDKFDQKLKTATIEYEKLKRSQLLTYVYFVVFIIISITVITGGYLLGKYALDSGVISTVPIIIMAVGLAPLGMAFGTLNKYRRDMEIAQSKKSKIDAVLDLYGIRYDIEIQFGKEYHGTQDVQVDIDYQGLKFK